MAILMNWTIDNLTENYQKSSRKWFEYDKRPYTKQAMMDILFNQSSLYDMADAIMALASSFADDKKETIEYIKNFVCYKNMDIQAVSVLSIGILANGTENKFFGELLLNKEYRI
jgi:hypothetical protein